MAYKRATRTVVRRGAFGQKKIVREALGAWTDLAQKDCGSDQRFDPDYTFLGIKGQCVNADQYNAYHANNPSSSSSSGGSFWGDLAAGLASVVKPATPSAPVVVQGGGGLGTVGTIAIVGGAGVVLYLLLKK